ncbi:MAG: flagellar motor protein [Syntrophomonadaceae bacterium]|nr:flagellar motor protein [Syntrophomonadaceae bacterium]
MDLATIGGVILAFAMLLGAFALEGGSMSMLLVGTAAMIVFGGTIGATVVSFPLEAIKKVPYFLKSVFKNDQIDFDGYLELLVKNADKARREGFLSLENQLDQIDDDFLVKGLQMVVDGADPEMTKSLMQMEIDVFEKNEMVGAQMFMTAGGFAPTMGIIGTVMGMVNVLSNLSNPDELGGAIAVAFLATLYGIASANLLWIPFANKIKNNTKKRVFLMEMMVEGIMSIQSGENPRILREKLKIYLPSETREELDTREKEKMVM